MYNPNNTSITGCTQFTYGEVEDYSVTVKANLATDDLANKSVKIYPNPVVEYLNISASTKVESVTVHNIAGQKMPVAAKLVNGKVDMSRLAPGVYIITTVLDGGKKESFKVVKK